MSDDIHERVTGGIHVSTAEEAAADAGKPKLFHDPAAELESAIKQTIEMAHMNSHHRMMAQAKAQELMFWLRAGWGHG